VYAALLRVPPGIYHGEALMTGAVLQHTAYQTLQEVQGLLVQAVRSATDLVSKRPQAFDALWCDSIPPGNPLPPHFVEPPGVNILIWYCNSRCLL
jgi:hypothetical protein